MNSSQSLISHCIAQVADEVGVASRDVTASDVSKSRYMSQFPELGRLIIVGLTPNPLLAELTFIDSPPTNEIKA